MKRAAGARTIGLIALALVATVACNRNEPEPTGQAEITSGEMQQQQQAEQAAAAQAQQERDEKRVQDTTTPGAVPLDPRDRQSSINEKPDEGARAAATPTAPIPTKKAVITKKAKTTTTKNNNKLPVLVQDREPIIGTTETTSADVEMNTNRSTSPPTTEPQPETQSVPQTQSVSPPSLAPLPYVNHSTVFGDGKSGMYTDGQGTYGGRTTWGTGVPSR